MKFFVKAFIIFCWANLSWASEPSFYNEVLELYNDGRYEEILARVDGHDDTKPLPPKIRFLKGLSLIGLNELSEAEIIFRQISQESPQSPEPHNNLAYIYSSRGEYDKAKKALESALGTNEAYSVAYQNLREIFSKQASEAYRKVLQKDSNGSKNIAITLIDELQMEEPILSVADRDSASLTERVDEGQNNNDNQVEDKYAEVKLFVNNWASAWEKQDVDLYLSYYSKAFKPTKKEWQKWAKIRRARIKGPSSISLSIKDIEVTPRSTDKISVRFKQHYRSDLINSTGNKKLLLIKEEDRWLIGNEVFSK